jgi:hypothetical protein
MRARFGGPSAAGYSLAAEALKEKEDNDQILRGGFGAWQIVSGFRPAAGRWY